MKFITIIATAVAIAGTASAVTDRRPDVDHLLIHPIMWRGHIFPEGPEVALNGTAESILAQIKELNPDYDAQLQDTVEESNTSRIGKRSNRVSFQCGINRWGWAQMGAISVGIQTIRNFGGSCAVGPNTCGRFSCSYNSAILMCNSEDSTAVVDCATLAQNANFLYWQCKNSDQTYTNGQAFYINPNYNVIVKQTDPGKGC